MAPSQTSEHTVCYRHPRVETAVSCSDCGRYICTDCMVFGPVGIRCPECAGRPAGARKAVQRVRDAGERAPLGIVTTSLLVANVVVYLAEIGTGTDWQTLSGPIYEQAALYGPAVDAGDWWRLITAAFLHAGPIHLLFNMLALWWFGRPLEAYVGPVRFISLYLVSALAGSAGALLLTPTQGTVGASGAIFGVLGAGLVLERRRIYVFGGSALFLILINLILTFTISGISIGGHLGGLFGGIAAMLVLLRFGRGQPALSRAGLEGLALLAGIALVAVALSYARVRGLG